MLTAPPSAVLAHFGLHTGGLAWRRAAGGFSGAVVWIGEGDRPPVALKMWPPNTSAGHLLQMHAWMTAARQRLRFVPGGYGLFEHDGHLWDCCTCMLGAPRAAPNAEEVWRACAAVAELHKVWAEREPHRGPIPGVRDRLHVLAENEQLLRAGPNSLPPVSPQLDPLLRRAVSVVAEAAPLAVAALRPWEGREFALHPCVRDLRGEHVLFFAGSVSGIIDYGAAAVDHAAGDLARLLDDYADTDEALFDTGLEAYRATRPAFDASDDFVRLLARSGAVCSVLGWLVRLVVRREPVSDAGAIFARLSQLLSRTERIVHF